MPNLDPFPSPLELSWTLEVVRGASAGRVYPLKSGELILGNGVPEAEAKAFLNLADQEGASPRKMAARHAALSRSGPFAWTLRDLETPGGTFVNNRRVLPGISHPLSEGDVIQVGSVQLRLARTESASLSAASPGSGFTYRSSRSGTTCRSWDDFLTFSAQRWDELRDDLVSGRLGDFLRSVGRSELSPPTSKTTSTTEQADERLDAWLARLPTRTPSKPELDVHPLRVAISVSGGGVTVRRKVRVANVGHRLLRAKVGVESAGAILTLSPDFDGREIVVRDFIDVAFEVAVPDPFTEPLTAQLVVTGGGEEKRVLIQVDRKANPAQSGLPDDDRDLQPLPIAGPLASFAALSVGKRIVISASVATATRLAVGVVGGAIGEDAMVASGPDVPRLGAAVSALCVVGACLGGWLALRRGTKGDAISGAVAGAGLGTLLASVLVATCRAIEPLLGPMASSPVAVCGLWAALGAALASVLSVSARSAVEPTKEPKS